MRTARVQNKERLDERGVDKDLNLESRLPLSLLAAKGNATTTSKDFIVDAMLDIIIAMEA